MTCSTPLLRAFVLLGLLAVALVSMLLVPTSASAYTLNQCNGYAPAGAEEMRCSYVVVNTVSGTAKSSSVQTQVCKGPVGAPICGPLTTTTNATDVVTAINQCNNSLNMGGVVVTCSARVTNNLRAMPDSTPATVNQCVGSGTGGGGVPDVGNATLCSPYPATTTSATVTQCNTAGNGGGADDRVKCTVDGTATTNAMLLVRITQCNDSANGGGDLVTCSADLDNLRTADAVVDDDATGDTTDDGGGTGGDTGGGGTGGTGGTGGGGGGGDLGSGTEGTGGGDDGSQVTTVPTGGAGTGGGSTSVGPANGMLLAIAGLLFSSGVLLLAWQRVRVAHARR